MKYNITDFEVGDIIVWTWKESNDPLETNICVVTVDGLELHASSIYADYDIQCNKYTIRQNHVDGSHRYMEIVDVRKNIADPSLENIKRIMPEYFI